MQRRLNYRGGFALPTVLIASVVMLTILAVSVSSVTAIRTTLKTQYYEQLAKAAGEAGVAYAKACLAQNGNVPLWTDNKPLTPSTDCAGNQLLSPQVQALVVAGGGGGGEGGGGGGGVQYNGAVDITAQSYPIVVGSGGAGSTNGNTVPANGQNSSAFGIMSIGGGYGGVSNTPENNGNNGGSGGGGRRDGGGVGGAGTLGQGYDGGTTVYQSGVAWKGGAGGGGAGGVGLPGTGNNTAANETAGQGGPGVANTISGAAVYYGGGGGGGVEGSGGASTQRGLGGIGGGGNGYSNQGGTFLASAGQPNTGGGGGGRPTISGSGTAGSGAAGVVIIKYGDTGSVVATGGSVTTTGGYKVHTFTTSGTFNVTSVGAASCPTDPRCSVTIDTNLRSSFRVTKPAVDQNGRALTIPNSGYVELLRSSTGEVWRTYRQPAVQSAAVPDLCSGAATSSLGWQNAVVTATQQALSNATSARTISMLDAALAAGKVYFRKDFTVVESGSYSLSAITDSTSTIVAGYIDGQSVMSAQGPTSSGNVSLSAGCHTLTVQMTNRTLQPRAARFTAALQKSGAAPIVATDATWRVSSGSSVHFSQPDFYADPALWTAVTDYQNQTAQQANSAWQTTQGDAFTRMISPTVSGCAATCPAPASFYLRDSKDFYVSTPTEVQVSTLCDDDCSVYMDGQQVIASSPWYAINQQTLTLTPGPHHVAVRTFNVGTNPNPSGTAVSVVAKDTGVVLTRTDRSWLGAVVSTPGTNATTEDIRSYEDSFRPSPDEIPRPPKLDFLVVAGGGGGGINSAGGGGGGGVIYATDASLGVGTYTVTVGAGGAGATSASARASKGANSVFGSNTAIGGSGGASRDGGLAPESGGSGGGGSGSTGGTLYIGGAGTTGQGFAGGNGTPPDQGVAAKGGGGGGAGGAGVSATTAVAGNGAAGFVTYLTGSRLAFAGGGGGGITAGNGAVGIATDGGTNGVANSPTAASPNTGGGGGGSGLTGSNGGSGVVIVRIKTGSMTVSTTGSPTVTNVTINGTAYTIYRYNASGSFTISALN